MLVESLKHGRAVIQRFRNLWREGTSWLVIDTETKAKDGFPKDDALVIHRADIVFFALCYKGESYSFPTNKFSTKYPTIYQWCDLLRSIIEDKAVIKVMHNANYDINQFKDVGLQLWTNIWCTMIGAWKAEADLDKGLKSRAQNFGRMLRKTASIDFSSLFDLASYVEEDVIATDELFQMQKLGVLYRPKAVHHLNAQGKIVGVNNALPSGRLVIENEDLDETELRELNYQEFPYLRATIRAERRGLPFDLPLLRKIRTTLAQDRDSTLKDIFKISGQQINLNSPQQMAKLFDSLGIGITKKTKKGAPSVSAKSLMSLKGAHPIIEKIQEYKKLEKLQTTYTGIPNPVNRSDMGLEHYVQNGRIHALVNTIGSLTGRTTCLTGNILVKTSCGDLPVIDIVEANEAKNKIKAKTHKGRFKEVTAGMRNGQRQVYRLETIDGKWIEATKDHLFLTPSGWRALGELSAGDTVITH